MKAGQRDTPTLDDVARLAGVSTATVSRCLNDPERVVEKTRARVMEAVNSLNYTPNFAARVMAAKRTFTIGAIIPTMENAIFARGLQAFQEALFEKGYTLLVASSAYKPEVEAEQIRSLVSRGADGLLLIGHDRDPEIYRYLADQNVPALAAWAAQEDAPTAFVGFDNRGAMAALAARVLDHGHQAVAVISADLKGNDRAQMRLEGVRDAWHGAGRAMSDLKVVETSYDIENGAAAFASLMGGATPPTAIICGNDVLAVGALMGAQRAGMRVPEDVSITGFDDIELARVVTPALTTVHVPHREMGQQAAHLLMALVERQEQPENQILDTRIVVGGSLGPVPKSVQKDTQKDHA